MLAVALVTSWGCDSQASDPPAKEEAPADAPAAPQTPPQAKDASVLPDARVQLKPGQYNFSRDLFSDRVESWSKVLTPLAGKPDLHYLEVGVFEGRSVVWMLENILTDPSSRVTAVDIFPADLEQRFRANVAHAGASERVAVRVGQSREVLPGLPATSVDVAYIDGSHTADDVLADAVGVWRLLEPGGVLIFDDFLWVGRGGKQLLPTESRPSLAVAAFLTTHRNEIELLYNDYQVMIRKVANPCPSKHYCTPLGSDHAYMWRERILLKVPGNKPVPLQDGDADVLERLVLGREFGEVGFDVAAAQAEAVVERLGLQLAPPLRPLSDKDKRVLLGVADPPSADAE